MTFDEIIKQALYEDIREGDHTSLSTIPSNSKGKAQLIVKENGIIAGVEIAKQVFKAVDPSLKFIQRIEDGSAVKVGDIVFDIEGSSISILSGERLALNFMQRMSGIATATSIYVEKIGRLKTRLLDTRKTTPLLRELEKMAVRLGGGDNHRMGLYDMIMIKDNHIDFAGGIDKAIDACTNYLKQNNLVLKVEIEVRNLQELNQVLAKKGVNRIMLDNFSVDDMIKAVNIVKGRYETEASGGITLDTIRSYAETGVDFVSVGALTHHIRSLDLSLKAI
ncbi:MAG: carboxylating nicotinate-nucleotide diphosphorylase [Bacteroidales bacterium]|jgi:nicotinate-nucleotide pyrophosphorylase (carboxylating)|nr:carboxylating nicotinate-nucleotide diphosphorylase [Bacteroidales bacterium]